MQAFPIFSYTKRPRKVSTENCLVIDPPQFQSVKSTKPQLTSLQQHILQAKLIKQRPHSSVTPLQSLKSQQTVIQRIQSPFIVGETANLNKKDRFTLRMNQMSKELRPRNRPRTTSLVFRSKMCEPGSRFTVQERQRRNSVMASAMASRDQEYFQDLLKPCWRY